MTQPKLTLTYFNIKGRAEVARMVFNYGDIDFTDERIASEDFASLKPTLPFKQLPVLKVNDMVYAESMAIVRYGANLVGLYPCDAQQALKVDMVSYALNDLEGPYVEIKYMTKDETAKAQKTKEFVEETVPKVFATLEKMVTDKFIAGDKLSFADIQLLDMIENRLKPVFPECNVDKFTKLTGVVANVKADPKIAAYLSKQ